MLTQAVTSYESRIRDLKIGEMVILNNEGKPVRSA